MNGKGDTDRTADRARYRREYDRIFRAGLTRPARAAILKRDTETELRHEVENVDR